MTSAITQACAQLTQFRAERADAERAATVRAFQQHATVCLQHATDLALTFDHLAQLLSEHDAALRELTAFAQKIARLTQLRYGEAVVLPRQTQYMKRWYATQVSALTPDVNSVKTLTRHGT